jgi:hypothetical protein
MSSCHDVIARRVEMRSIETPTKQSSIQWDIASQRSLAMTLENYVSPSHPHHPQPECSVP